MSDSEAKTTENLFDYLPHNIPIGSFVHVTTHPDLADPEDWYGIISEHYRDSKGFPLYGITKLNTRGYSESCFSVVKLS